MANNLSSILTFPPEACHGEIVELIPTDLLSEEVVTSCQSCELWDLSVVTERVGEPESATVGTESRVEVSLTEEELSNKRFSRGKKLIRFYPHTSC